jgi:hypothetical protein
MAITNDSLRKLSNFKLLSSLAISYTDIDDATLSHLCVQLPHLATLNISGCARLSQLCISQGLCLAKSLRSLYMSYCENLLSADLVLLVTNSGCLLLKLVKIYHPSFRESVELIAKAMTKVQPHIKVECE